ncbi:MAG TPA: DMT family transporter [Casimicrobiaceae bacterium]|nr:DMT family transporter [Casimicrobiaceae bacterium]
MSRPAHMPFSAILMIVAATACFTTLDVSVKYLSQRYPVPLLVWARWGMQVLVMAAVLGPTMRWGLVRTARRKMHLVRGIVLIASSLSFFSALKFLPLAEATALNYSTPMIVTLMAATFLQERITIPRWAFVIAGFIGMLLIVRPGSEMLTPASLLALASAALYATFQIMTRKLAGEDSMVLLFFPALVGTLIMSALLPFLHYDTWFPVADVAMFVVIGAIGTVGHFLFILAFQRASVSAIAPFTYMQLLWSTLAGWLVFGTFPDAWALAGIVTIAGSGVVLTWYERWRASLPASEPTAVD